MSKTLILGGAGFLGGILQDILTGRGHSVRVFDCLLYESRYLKPCDFIFGDIRDTEEVLRAAEDCDTVVNMAAVVGDLAASVNPLLTREVNYLAVERLAKQLSSDKKLISISTCSVFGQADDFLDELSPIKPLSVYAHTKFLSEEPVLNRGGTILRLGTVSGLGDDWSRCRFDLVGNSFALKAVKYGKLTVQGGNQWRPLITTRTVGNYIAEAVEYNRPGLFVLAQENTTIKDLAERVVKVLPGTEIEYTEMLGGDARNYKVNTSKADRVFDFKPTVTIEDEVLRVASLIRSGRIRKPESAEYSNGNYLQELRAADLFK